MPATLRSPPRPHAESRATRPSERAPPPHGLPGDLLSVEAAIAACERFGLGERLVAVLEAEQERVQAAVAEDAAGEEAEAARLAE